MPWRYQIIYHDETDHPYCGLHEIYYKKDGTIYGWTEDGVGAMGDSAGELIEELRMMLEDAEKYPVLIESELENLIKG